MMFSPSKGSVISSTCLCYPGFQKNSSNPFSDVDLDFRPFLEGTKAHLIAKFITMQFGQ